MATAYPLDQLIERLTEIAETVNDPSEVRVYVTDVDNNWRQRHNIEFVWYAPEDDEEDGDPQEVWMAISQDRDDLYVVPDIGSDER